MKSTATQSNRSHDDEWPQPLRQAPLSDFKAFLVMRVLCYLKHRSDIIDILEDQEINYVDETGALKTYTFDFVVTKDDEQIAICVKTSDEAQYNNWEDKLRVIARGASCFEIDRIMLFTEQTLALDKLYQSRELNYLIMEIAHCQR